MTKLPAILAVLGVGLDLFAQTGILSIFAVWAAMITAMVIPD